MTLIRKKHIIYSRGIQVKDSNPENKKKTNNKNRAKYDVLHDGEINDLFKVRSVNNAPKPQEIEKAAGPETAKKTNAPKKPVKVKEPDVIQEPVASEEPVIADEKKQSETKETAKDIPETSPEEKPQPSPAKKRALYALIGVLLIVLSFVLGYFVRPLFDPDNSLPDSADNTSTGKMPKKYEKVWTENKAINEDYVGQIIFDSGLIDVPFVQAKSVYKENGDMYVFYNEDGSRVTDPAGYNGNDVYIWTNWKTGKYDSVDEGGSIFMDYRNSLDDQNILVYGHHFSRDYDPSGTKQFTPLDLLTEEENYKKNCKLKLILDKEIRYYTVAEIFVIDMYDLYQIQIARPNMDVDLYGDSDPGFFTEYIEYMDEVSYYDTGVELNENDSILTLVTCIQSEPQYREIIVCKLTDTEYFQ